MSRLPGESLNKKKVILLCPLLHIDLGLSVHLSPKKNILFFSSSCKFGHWALKTCNKDISRTITASSLKFGQLIENDEWITW